MYLTRTLLFLVSPVLLLANTTVAAEAETRETVKWYDVEIIVFRHADPRSDETWPTDAGTPVISGMQALFPAAGDDSVTPAQSSALDDAASRPLIDAPEPFTALPDDELQLINIENALERSSRYESLLHVGWSQPSLELDASPQLRITLPGALDAAEETTTTEQVTVFTDDYASSAPRPEAGNENDDDTDSPFARPLDGYVQLGVGRYLHLGIDLLYLPQDINPDVIDGALPEELAPVDESDREQRRRMIMEALARGELNLEEAEILTLEPEEPVFQGFRIREVRRIRSNALHYFDHPIFGVLVRTTPREIEVAPASNGMSRN
jgi:hypothetical protein